MGASRFPSSLGEGPPRKRIVEQDCVLSCKNKKNITRIIRKERDTFKIALIHLRFGPRLVLIMRLRFDVFEARASHLRHLASLRSLLLPIFVGGPFLPRREGDSGPPSLLSSDEGILIPPNTKSDVPLE